MQTVGQGLIQSGHRGGWSWRMAMLVRAIGMSCLILAGCSGGGSGGSGAAGNAGVQGAGGNAAPPAAFAANGAFNGNLTVTQGGQSIRVGVIAHVTGGTTVQNILNTTLGRHVTLSGQATSGTTATVSGLLSGTCQGSVSTTMTLNADQTLTVDGTSTDCNGALSFQGTLVPVTCTAVTEQEPNNSRSQFQDLGAIAPGSCRTIAGTLPDGDLDTFTFITQTPQTILALLTHHPAINFDLAYFSEEVADFLRTCNIAESPETCAITRLISAQDRLHLIATNFGAGTNDNYTLLVSSTPPLTAASSAALVAAQQPPGGKTVEPGYVAVETSTPNTIDAEAQMMFDMRLGEFLLP